MKPNTHIITILVKMNFHFEFESPINTLSNLFQTVSAGGDITIFLNSLDFSIQSTWGFLEDVGKSCTLLQTLTFLGQLFKWLWLLAV